MDNPLCGIGKVEDGEIVSFYCDMFGQYIIVHRPGVEADMEFIEMFANTMNASKKYIYLKKLVESAKLYEQCS